MSSNLRLVYFNGDFIPEAEARLSIYDSALMFGDMVFEMTRRVQFKLRDHLERLYTGLKVLRIDVQLTIDEMEDAVQETILRNAPCFAIDDEHRVMIDVTRGLLGIYQGIVGVPTGSNVIIAVFPLRWTVAGMGKLFDLGINAVIPSQRTIPAHLLDPKVKNRSRLHYMMANIEVSRVEGENNWALLLDPDGFITEGTGDNFFIVKNGLLISPEPRNILRGISRAYVLEELALQLAIPCAEKNIEPYDVLTADEAFMTATPFCILPVTSLNGVRIGEGGMGPISRRLLDQWGKNVGVDIPGQIKEWNLSQPAIHPGAPTPYSFRRK
jgi:branched-chain amino acid aminotransferase